MKVASPDNVNNKNTVKYKGVHVTPTRHRELDLITKLFQSILPFTPMGRKITDNWLWDSYNQSKIKVTKSADIEMSDHEKQVAEVFSMLGASNATIDADDVHVEEQFTTKDSELAAKKFNQADFFTETGEEMTLDDNCDKESYTHNTTQTNNNTAEVDIDPADALKSLCNLKKYKINMLCIDNLKVPGRNMIGDKIEEDRRWATMVKLRERK